MTGLLEAGTRPILYYVHHQGRGHLDRALAIASYAPSAFVLLGTGLRGRTGSIAAIDLDDDLPIARSAAAVTPALHYAPRDHPGIRNRVAAIAASIAGRAPGLFVVDVSVEIALLAVIASVPMVYVRLSGDRRDLGHETVFQAALHLIAPFHHNLEDPGTPQWVVDKTIYLPGLTTAAPVERGSNSIVLVVAGAGGAICDGEQVAMAARATPEFQWRCIGPVSVPAHCPPNLAIKGWSSTPNEEIAAAAIIVGGAGDGLVSAVLAVNRPFICIPEQRPYHEQQVKAAALERTKVAIVLPDWPGHGEWRRLLARALDLDPVDAARLHNQSGTARAAEHLIAMVRSA